MCKLISAGKIDIAMKFLNVCRYIDDLLAVDIPDMADYLYLDTQGHHIGIYPKDILTLELADDGETVPYMDILIRQNKRRGLLTAIYDKRLDAKYSTINVVRYPHVDSYLADAAKYGIVTSQLHRFSSRCVLKQDFVYNIALVMHRMIRKGYHTIKMWKNVRRFFNSYPRLYDGVSYSHWERRIRHKIELLNEEVITPGPHGQIYVQ